MQVSELRGIWRGGKEEDGGGGGGESTYEVCLCVCVCDGSWADTWLGRERFGLGWGRASDGRVRGVGLLYVRVDLWVGWTWAWAPQFVCSLFSREAVHRMIDRGERMGAWSGPETRERVRVLL